MTERPYPSDDDRLRGNIREELCAQSAGGHLGLDEVVIGRLAEAIARNIEYAFDIRWAPSWVKEGEPHHWTEQSVDGGEQYFVDCPRCRTLTVHASAAQAADWWAQHLERQQAEPFGE